jgi:hypothetical protein
MFFINILYIKEILDCCNNLIFIKGEKEDIILIILLYSIFKYFVMFVIHELVWPTQLFNKKHNIVNKIIRFREYNEYLLKLKNKNFFFNIYFAMVYNYKYE